jgi:hypothetical protein
VPGTVLPGDGAPSGDGAPAAPHPTAPGDPTEPPAAEPQAAPSAGAVPELFPITGAPAAAETTLAAASEPAGGGYGLVVAGLGAAVAGATMLVVRRLRAARR